ARRRPGIVLGLEEAGELRVRDLDAEVAEKVPDEARILDLLDRARKPEEGQVRLGEVRGERVRLGHAVTADRREPGAMTGLEQRRLPLPAHERVAPVEEDRLDHRGLR